MWVPVVGAVCGAFVAAWILLWVFTGRWPSCLRPCKVCKHDGMMHRIEFGTTRCWCCLDHVARAKKNR